MPHSLDSPNSAADSQPDRDELQLVESYIRLAEGRKDSTGDTAELDNIVDRFELELGVKKPVELTRWYLLSVIRSLQGESWNDPEQCGFNIEQQEELAVQYLSNPGAFRSLSGVLRKKHLRYTLVNFSDKANSKAQILSTKTRAFSLAEDLLFDKIANTSGSRNAASEGHPNTDNAPFTFELHEENMHADESRSESPDGTRELQSDANADSESSAELSFDSNVLMPESEVDFSSAASAESKTTQFERSSANSINMRRAARRSTAPQMNFPFNQDLFADGSGTNGANETHTGTEAQASAALQEMDEDEFLQLEKAMEESKKGSFGFSPKQQYRQSMYAGVAFAWFVFLLYFLITS